MTLDPLPSRALVASRRVAAELAAEATDPEADLTIPERRWLAALSAAIETVAAQREASSVPPAFPSDRKKGVAEIDALPGR